MAELQELKAAGLTHLWWGVETAAPNLLKFVQKEPNPDLSAAEIEARLIQAAEILTAAQLFYIPIILIGLGGMTYFEEHSTYTRKFLETIQPPGFCLSNLVVDPNSQYAHQLLRRQIELLTPAQMQLQRACFESLAFPAIQFDYEI
ncbi:hypothetical protein L0128_14800 [candidate division KSB1 bacterium]|nr:hypothetical protein [candidate division KSB1 bacterium]